MQTAEVASVTSSQQSRGMTKKWLISAVVFLLTIAIVASCVLVGIWMFTEQHKATLQFTMKLLDHGQAVGREEVITDVTDNVIQYHVTNNNSQWWIVEDYKTGLKVAKVNEGQGRFKCLVSVLQADRHGIRARDVHEQHVNSNEDNVVGGVEVTWVSKESVDDTSFLGEAARRLCVNTPVYWSHSYGVNTLPEASDTRSKRAADDKCIWCLCGYKFCFPYNSCSAVAATFQVVNGQITCNLHVGGDNCPRDRNVITAYNCP